MYKYVYDAWNRLIPGNPAAGRYDDGRRVRRMTRKNRRTEKVVSNSGIEETSGDGGNVTVHYYYSQKWQILETRNGSNQATRQWVYRTQYVDEPLLMDVNLEPGTDNDCDPDNETGSESSSGTNDRRYVLPPGPQLERRGPDRDRRRRRRHRPAPSPNATPTRPTGSSSS